MRQLEFAFTRDADGHWHLWKVAREYGLALIVVLASFGLRLAFDSHWGDQMAYFVFFPAILFCVAFLGRGAAFFAIILSAALANWFFVEPRYSFAGKTLSDFFAAAVFILTSLSLLALAVRSRLALDRERSSTRALESRTQELAASEEINRRMLASIPDCVNMLSPDGRLLSINEAGRRLFEVQDAFSWLRHNWVYIWPEEHRPVVRNSIQRATSGEIARFLANCATARGKMRWWDVVLSPVFDRDGKPERLLAISRDVTDSHESEARRLESDERRQLAMAATDDAIWDWDLSTDRITVNEAYLRSYGPVPDTCAAQWHRNRIHPDDRERVRSTFEAVLAGNGLHWAAEFRFRRTDDSWGDVLDRAYIARDPDGRPRRVVGAMMNLSPLRKAEWRAALVAETSSLLLRTESPQTIVDQLCKKVMHFLGCDVFFNFLLDTATGELRLNACGGTSGMKAGEVIDKGAVCAWVAGKGEPIVVEDIANSSDPRVEWVASLGIQAYACNPLKVNGRTIGTLSFGTKSRTRFEQEELALMKAVTDQVAIAMERQETAAQLRRVNEDLEQRVAQRTESLAKTTEQLNSFCYSIAHDLRAPLRTQTGFARLLLDDYSCSIDDTGKYYLKAIMQAAERQSQIIQDLMAHVNVSRADLEMELVELGPAVEQARADLEVELQQREATVLASDLDGQTVVANRSSLHLVLLNLLSNACKFVEKGTKPVVSIRCGQHGDKIRLSVQDNGIGIAAKDQCRLFGMFQRLNKGDFPGTGMGLAIVKTAIERMGGSVGLESEPGKGASFWVELRSIPKKPRRAMSAVRRVSLGI